MSKRVSDILDGKQRVEPSRLPPTDREQASSVATIHDDADDLRAQAKRVIRDGGGIEYTASALDREPTYATKISEGMNGRNGRTLQLEWLAPHLRNTEVMFPFIAFLSELAGLEPPVRARAFTDEERATAIARAVDSIRDEGIKETILTRAAEVLGVRVDRLK